MNVATDFDRDRSLEAMWHAFRVFKFARQNHVEIDAGVVHALLNARYYESARGQFISQDPVFWEIGLSQDGRNALSNPQALNSYSYASDNPITNKDPSGRWYKEFMTGQQSWPSFQLELGGAANQLAQDSAGWNFAFDHPYTTGALVGAGAGGAAWGASAALTSFSVDALAGIGTRSMGNLSRLEGLPQTSKSPFRREANEPLPLFRGKAILQHDVSPLDVAEFS
jgi:RHS repeat-associated protein